MKPEDCPKLDDCPKIKMVLDKDLLDFQYAEAIRAVCAKCKEVPQGDKKPSPINSLTSVISGRS